MHFHSSCGGRQRCHGLHHHRRHRIALQRPVQLHVTRQRTIRRTVVRAIRLQHASSSPRNRNSLPSLAAREAGDSTACLVNWLDIDARAEHALPRPTAWAANRAIGIPSVRFCSRAHAQAQARHMEPGQAAGGSSPIGRRREAACRGRRFTMPLLGLCCLGLFASCTTAPLSRMTASPPAGPSFALGLC